MTTSNTFSLTVRPKDLNNFMLGGLIEWFKEQKAVYIIGFEQGNHYQIGFLLPKEMRQDNLRSRVLTKFMRSDSYATDPENWGVALKLKKHNNWDLLIGYCSKEKIYDTNLADWRIEECKKIYDDMKMKSKRNKNSIDDVVNTFLEYCIKSNMGFTNELWRIWVGKVRIPFSTYQKINQEKLEEYITSVYRDIKFNKEPLIEFDEVTEVDE